MTASHVKAHTPTQLWHSQPASAIADHLEVAIDSGLSAAEVDIRRTRHGENRITPKAGRSALFRFALQFSQPLVLVLLLAGIVTAFLGEWVDFVVILGVTIINAVIGHVQEGRAENALAALARSVASEITVLRDGIKQRQPSTALVPGDIVLLAAGDRVPADLRLLRAKELQAIEASLTGESTAVAKDSATLPADTQLAERNNMAYAGTVMVSGQGAGVVVATGDASETGRIARLIAEAPELSTPLTRKMTAFSNWLLLAITAFAVLTFAVGLWRGESAYAMFMAAVALAVGAIPEGLPAAITITLAIGVSRMAKRRAIIRKLPAVETLGSTTVICSDKTGTLTENQMTVRELYVAGQRIPVSGSGYAPKGEIGMAGETVNAAVHECLLAGALCNDAAVHKNGKHWEIVGDPTEGALLVAARKGGLDEMTVQTLFPRHDELPFDANRQYMATLHDIEGVRLAYFKGAVERILPRATQMLNADGLAVTIDADAITQAAREMAAQGQRVLALARLVAPGFSTLTGTVLDETSALQFIGLVGMIDPPRPKAIRAVQTCHAAGIVVKMITGDHALTALSIARQLGIAQAGDAVLTGRELAALDEATLGEKVRSVNVFARVEPEQKLRLVRALQANGEVVAMTGDGVNDAPALKQADIGVAMGLAGTEVAKEAAAMVLTDDDFSSIEAAVEEGRGIFDNLVKFITWTLPTNLGEGLVIVAATFAGTTLPITPLQILWINMTTAVFLGLTLSFEPVERGIMHRPPRSPKAPILDAILLWRVFLVSLLLLAGVFALFDHALSAGRSASEARTIAVNAFVVGEIFYLFNCRSLQRSMLAVGVFSNRWLWAGVAFTVLLQLAFTYLPLMNHLFTSAPIGLADWGNILLVGAVVGVVVGIEKWLRLKTKRGVGRQ